MVLKIIVHFAQSDSPLDYKEYSIIWLIYNNTKAFTYINGAIEVCLRKICFNTS